MRLHDLRPGQFHPAGVARPGPASTTVLRSAWLIFAMLLMAAQSRADSAAQILPFSQNWTSIGLITANDNWSGVPGFIGYRGDSLTNTTGANPQTILVDGTGTPVDVNANETNPNTFTTGGVTEFHLPDPCVALAGSTTARAPFLLLNLNLSGQSNLVVRYNLRDIDGSADDAIQPVALQYRVGNSGNFADLPAAFVADASTGPNLATNVTAVSLVLPAAVEHQPFVQLRWITTDAAGSDEWVGIDDIEIGAAPSIYVQPPSTFTAECGGSVSLAVSAVGSTPLSYQWRRNGVNLTNGPRITGADTATLTINPTALTDDGSYDVVVVNSFGTNTSTPAALNVVDTVVPSIVLCAPNDTLVANAACQAQLPDLRALVLAVDDCDPAPVVSQAPPQGTMVGAGAHQVTLTATDAEGNTNFCVATVTVLDQTAPTVACQNITRSLTGAPVVVTPAEVVTAASDSCGGVIGLSLAPSSFGCPGTFLATVTATDASGNSATCPTTITILDARPAPLVVYVDDNYAGLTNCTSVDFPHTGAGMHEVGYNAFATVQAAVNAVAPGGMVNVAGGVYAENIVLDRSLTLAGGFGGESVLRPALSDPNCGGGGGGSLCPGASVLLLVRADNVTIHGLTLDGDNPALTSGVLVNGADVDARNGIITDHTAGVYQNLVVHDVIVRNVYLRGIYASTGGSFNIFSNAVHNVSGDPAGSIAIFNFGGSGIFKGNLVSNCLDGVVCNWSTGTQFLTNTVLASGSGVHTDNNGGAGGAADLLQGNVVRDGSPGGYGVWVFAPFVEPQVIGNCVSNVPVGLAAAGRNGPLPVTTRFASNTVDGALIAGSAGVYLTTSRFGFGDTDVDALLVGNIIANCETGVYLETTASPPGLALNAALHRNQISGHAGFALTNTGPGTFAIDASVNHWGSANPAAIAALIADPAVVDFTPLLNLGDADPVAKGFQPDLSQVTVHALGFQSGGVGRLQEGANVVVGSTVFLAPGNYSDNVVLGTHVNFDGSGSGANPAVDSIVTAASAGLPVIAINDAGGTSGADRLTIKDLRLTGGADGIRVTASTGSHRFYDFENVTSVNNSGMGILLAGSTSLGDVRVAGSILSNNGNAGLRVESSLTSFDTLLVSGSLFDDNGVNGLSVNGTDANLASPGGVQVVGTSFSNNGSPASTGDGDISFFLFNGDAGLSAVSITADAQFPIQFRGKGTASPATWNPAGVLGLTNVTVGGTGSKPGLYLVRYADVASVNFDGVDLTGYLPPSTPLGFASAMQVEHIGAVPLNLGRISLPANPVPGGYLALAMLNSGGATATCQTVISGAYTPSARELAVADQQDFPGLGDVTFPSISVNCSPTPVFQEAAGPGGANVSFTVSGASDCDPSPAVVCVPPSGSLFALGSTTVHCLVTDVLGSSNACSFQVVVQDTTAPVITVCPTNRVLNAGVACQALVPNVVPEAAATDLVGPVTITQSPPAGTSIGLGLTTVVVTATDGAGNATNCSLVLNVIDSSPPVIGACPANILALDTDANGSETVSFAAPSASDNCPVSVVCVPASGSVFPLGANSVTCTATDSGGNTAACSFTVIVCPTNTPAAYVDDGYTGLPDGTAVSWPHLAGGPVRYIGCDAFASIQNGVDRVANGGVVHVASGTYAESVTIGKRLTLEGMGAATTLIVPPGVVGIAITDGGSSATDRLVVRGIRVAGTGGDGVQVQAAASFITFDAVQIVTNLGSGLHINGPGAHADIVVTNSDLSYNGNVGVLVASSAGSCTGLRLLGLTVASNYSNGLLTGPSGSPGVSGVEVRDSVFTGNGTTFASGGEGDLVFFGFNGTAVLSNLVITADARWPVQFRGRGTGSLAGLGPVAPIGTVELRNLSITGTSPRGLALIDYSDVSMVLFEGVSLGTVNPAGIGLYLENLGSALDIGDTVLGGVQAPNLTIANFSTGAVDATAAVFAGAADNFAIEDRVAHAIDVSGGGLVTWVPNQVYVTVNSFFSPLTMAALIQRGIDAAAGGWTVNVGPGVFNGTVGINKDNLVLQGSGRGVTILDTTTPNTGTGIEFIGGRSGVSLADFTVRHFNIGIHMPAGPLQNILVEDVDAVDNQTHGIWTQGFGINGMIFRRVNASRNNQVGGLAGRGLWMINGAKQNVVIEDGVFSDNGLVGIDISDGNVTDCRVTGNRVTGNRDSGIGVLGPQGPGSTLVAFNSVTNNGRFGIEIKNPTGNGASGGPGSVVVASNIVVRDIAATDARDHAGILVMRRFPVIPDNADQPSGVHIARNEVRGFRRKPVGSTGDGIGIVVAGAGHRILHNTASGCDVAYQVQGGNPAINSQGTPYFDRDDAAAGGALLAGNINSGNEIGFRAVGPTAGAILENNTFTGDSQAGIQAALGSTVDAGDCTGSNVTGLGLGSGPAGSSAGGNILTGYGFDNAPPWAIESLNTAAQPPVYAQNNDFGAASPADPIEALLFDDNDTAGANSAVLFSQLGLLVVACPPAVTVECVAGVPPGATTLAAFLAQGGAVSASAASVSFVDGPLTPGPAEGSFTRTYTVIDVCGNTTTCAQTITVDDTTPPVLVSCPANITVFTGPGRTTCDQAATWTPPTASDNCSVASISSTHPPGSVFPVGTTTVIYTATDGAGLTATCSFTVTVIDNTSPTIACPAPVVVAAGPGSCGTNLSLVVPAADNCGIASVIFKTNGVAIGSPNFFPLGVTAVEAIATDLHGNTASCTFDVKVVDFTGDLAVPCWRGTPGGTFQHWAFSQAPANPFPILTPEIVLPERVDSPGSPQAEVLLGAGFPLGYVDRLPGFGCRQGYWDLGSFGLISLAVPNVTGSAGAYSYVRVQVTQFQDSLIYTQMVSVSLASAATLISQGQTVIEPLPTGAWVVHQSIWRVPACPPVETIQLLAGVGGALVDQIVVDTLCLDFSFPSSFTVNADPGQCSASAVGWSAPAPDGCRVSSVVCTTNGVPVTNPHTFPVGVTPVACVLTDGEGGTVNFGFSVTVLDNQAPTAVCKPITLALNAAGHASITPAMVNDGSTDNCGAVTLVSVIPSAFTCANLGPNVVTLTVADAAGNTNTCQSVVTVIDVTPPVITLAGANPLNHECHAPFVDPGATATDVCAGVVPVSVSGTVNPNTPGTYVLTYTATDGSGNVATATRTVVVVDTVAPLVLTLSATQDQGSGPVNVLNCATTNLVGAVNISVQVIEACGLSGVPSISMVNYGTNTDNAVFVNESPAGTFNFVWNITTNTPNGLWAVTVAANDSANTGFDSFVLCVNKTQISGLVQMQNFTGTGTIPPHTRVATFVATEIPSPGVTNLLQTWVLTLTNVSGDTFAYTLPGVPSNTTHLSVKTAWSLRRKLPVSFDTNGQAIVNFTGAGQLKGGDFTGDNTVNLADYSVLVVNWLTANPAADINGDGVVNLLDYSILASNWFTAGDPP